MEVQINYLAVFLAGVSSMVVGGVWYMPKVFGDRWAKLVKLDDKKMKAGAAKALTLAFIMSLLLAYILAHVTYISEMFFKVSYMQAALTTAFWLWLGICVSLVVTHDAFEQRPTVLTALTLGNQLLTMVAMALIIGVMGV